MFVVLWLFVGVVVCLWVYVECRGVFLFRVFFVIIICNVRGEVCMSLELEEKGLVGVGIDVWV
jgi:hypothetical protein